VKIYTDFIEIRQDLSPSEFHRATDHASNFRGFRSEDLGYSFTNNAKDLLTSSLKDTVLMTRSGEKQAYSFPVGASYMADRVYLYSMHTTEKYLDFFMVEGTSQTILSI
jgi:hypothetical protein